jgi:hypothetical protein
VASAGQYPHTSRYCLAQYLVEIRIGLGMRFKGMGVRTLHNEDGRGPVPVLNGANHSPQVTATSISWRVWEAGGAILHQGYGLGLDPTAPGGASQQKVNSAVLQPDFGLEAGVAFKARQKAGIESFSEEGIGQAGIHADPDASIADQFEVVRGLTAMAGHEGQAQLAAWREQFTQAS